MPAYHNLLLTDRKNIEGVEFKLNQTGQLLCYVSNEFSSCAAGDGVSLLCGGSSHNRRAWNDNYVKGFVKN